MCLLFFFYNPTPEPDEYKLVMINNRDESYSRPTMPACFWPDYCNVIGGTDEEPDRRGGTWLAMNKNGKIACLLNIFQPKESNDPNKKGRGSLVKDFVMGKETPREYLEQIEGEGSGYNGFLLFAMNIASNQLCYYTNMGDKTTHSIEPGFHSFGNSPPTRLWQKTITGGEKFKKIVKSNMKSMQKKRMLEELEEMLKDKTRYPVDKQLAEQGRGYSESYLQKLHSVFVEIPESNYGTRSHTFILVDAHGQVEYIENSTGCKQTAHGVETSSIWSSVVQKFDLITE